MDQSLEKKVSDFMTKDVVSVKSDENLKHLFKILDQSAILGVPVVDDEDRVVGIVTETDLIEHFTTLETPKSTTLLGSVVFLENIADFNEKLKDHCAEIVKDMMTQPAITIPEDASLEDAINLMSEKSISRLPVTDEEGKLAGIITRTDIVHQLAKISNV